MCVCVYVCVCVCVRVCNLIDIETHPTRQKTVEYHHQVLSPFILSCDQIRHRYNEMQVNSSIHNVHTRHTRAIPSSLTTVCEEDFGRDDPASKPVVVVITPCTLTRQVCLFDGCARFAVPA